MRFQSVIVLLLSSVLSTSLAAQGLLLGPDTPTTAPGTSATPRPTRPGVHIVKTRVQATIVDGIATTTIDQVIANNTASPQEGTWFLPLPAGAVADAFTMSVDGREIGGEVLDAQRARGIYESIVRRRRDPGLLEYAGEGMLRARIFPIPANGEVGVTVRLRQVLQPIGAMYEWAWPVRVARLGDAGAGELAVDVRIESSTPLASVVTPHAAAEIQRTGAHQARVSLRGDNGDFEDLQVLYGLTRQEFGLHLLTWRDPADPGYFTMLLSPPRTLADAELPPRQVQLVVDTSGSMKGRKIQQAKASLRVFLDSLRPQDSFQIVTFSSSVSPFFEAPRPASAANIAAALERVETIEAMGGTNIADALQQALQAAPAAGDGQATLSQIILVTDGQPTVGLTDPAAILANSQRCDTGEARLFALGVGDAIDVRLIDDLVRQHRGARDFVGSSEKIEAKVDALCRKLSKPALADVFVTCEGLDSFHVHPATTRDLFCGEMMQVSGRYRNSGAHVVTVRGTQGGEAKQFDFEVEFPAQSAQHPFVQTLWARQHTTSLLDAIRRNGPKAELIAEVRSLATRYGIVTPYTSQLIVEEGMRLASVVPGRRDGRQYRGPGDVLPPSASRGPAGPSTGGPAGKAVGGAPGAGGLESLGRRRTGAAAVAESKATAVGDDFYLSGKRGGAAEVADRARDARAGRTLVRRAAGRVFLGVGEDLVEQGLPSDWRERAVVVESFSKQYFELSKSRPELRAILAMGERVVFRDGSRIVHVRPAAKPRPEGVSAASAR